MSAKPRPDRKLEAFLARPPDESRQGPSPAEVALLDYWNGLDDGRAGEFFLKHRLDMIRRFLAERGTAAQSPTERLLEAVFDELPSPVIIYQHDSAAWNGAFAQLLERDAAWQRGYPVTEQVTSSRDLESIIPGLRFLQLERVFFPLDGEVFRLHVMALPEERMEIVYLISMGIIWRDTDPETLAVLLLRLSGLAHKQIAKVMRTSVSRVSTISKRNRESMIALRSELITITA